jgi:hypothetical protein
MPWLIFGEPGFITPLHQAQTSVGNLRAALTIFFMIATFDRGGSLFVQLEEWRSGAFLAPKSGSIPKLKLENLEFEKA